MIVAHPTAEEQLLADAILRHRPLALAPALHAALHVAGEYVPEGEEPLLRAYAESIDIDMVPDGYRYVRRNRVPLLGLGPLEVFTEPGNPQLLTRCAVWYGADARAEWYHRGAGSFAAGAATPTGTQGRSPQCPCF